MKKQKSIGNKGFSLVELIIVIAIMAILIGVMAPQLLRYVERTRVSADTQVADTVRTAVTTAMLDPTVMTDANFNTDIATFQAAGGSSVINIGGNAFGNAVAETLGETGGTAITAAWVAEQLTSDDATDITVEIIGTNNVRVTITGSHADANGGADPITVE